MGTSLLILILWQSLAPTTVAEAGTIEKVTSVFAIQVSDTYSYGERIADHLNYRSLTDSDGDGIDDATEIILGLDPNDIDSDCDYVLDNIEVGNIATPTDTDSDGIIDALENRFADSDTDDAKDETDPTSGVQVNCGRFLPFAIQNNATDSARLEIRIVGGTNVTAVAVVANQLSSFFPHVGGILVNQNDVIQLFDNGTNGDRIAGDGLWTRDQFTSDIGLSQGGLATFKFNLVNVTENGVVKQIGLAGVFARKPTVLTIVLLKMGLQKKKDEALFLGVATLRTVGIGLDAPAGPI